jgi:hypothetical protein
VRTTSCIKDYFKDFTNFFTLTLSKLCKSVSREVFFYVNTHWWMKSGNCLYLTLIYSSIISTRMIIRQKIYTETFDIHVKSYNVGKCWKIFFFINFFLEYSSSVQILVNFCSAYVKRAMQPLLRLNIIQQSFKITKIFKYKV